jgi:hypothetical protein
LWTSVRINDFWNHEKLDQFEDGFNDLLRVRSLVAIVDVRENWTMMTRY